MLDEIIVESFNLDYEILNSLSKNKIYADKLENPRMISKDIYREYDNLVKSSKQIFEQMKKLLSDCNEQRMNFRVLIIKMSKDRQTVNKFFQDEDETLILNKLSLHSELKEKMLDTHIATIMEKEETINLYKSELYSKIINQTKPTKLSVIKNTSNKKYLPANKNLINNYSNYKLKHEIANIRTKIIKDSPIESLNNTVNEESLFKKMFNMDYNTEKYNIISSSPIQSPKNKHNNIENIQSINGNSNSYNPSSKAQQPNHLSLSMNINPNTLNNFVINNLNNISSGNEVLKTRNSIKNDNTLQAISRNVNVNNINNVNNVNSVNNINNVNNSNATKRKFLSRSIDCDISYENYHCNTQGDNDLERDYVNLNPADVKTIDIAGNEESYNPHKSSKEFRTASFNSSTINNNYSKNYQRNEIGNSIGFNRTANKGINNNINSSNINSNSSNYKSIIQNNNFNHSTTSSRETSLNRNQVKNRVTNYNTIQTSQNVTTGTNNINSNAKKSHLKSLISISKDLSNFSKFPTAAKKKFK
jgi:hypothetical protein